jgi:hypothetical protein
MRIKGLVIDRTQKDVDDLAAILALSYDQMTAEQRKFVKNPQKGAYNVEDLNRVEGAVEYLKGIAQSLPVELNQHSEEKGVAFDVFFNVPYTAEEVDLTTKTDWKPTDYITESQMTRYLGNVRRLANTIDIATDPLPEKMSQLNWQGANAIEKALDALESGYADFKEKSLDRIDRAAESWYYSDEKIAGEV